jgi:arylsulfatase A
MLQSKGYQTAAIGKWHLGFDWEAIRQPEAESTIENRNTVWSYDAFDWSQPISDGPLAHGFDHYFGDGVINFPPYCWIEDDKVNQAPDTMMNTELWKPIKEGSWECRPGPMISGWDPYAIIPTLTQRAVDYIEAQANNEAPFFLYFALPSPHAPIIPNDQFDGKSEAGAYGDFMYETDDACGQILQALEASGQADNTIVVFTADNGPEHYAYERDTKYDHWSSAPCRGLKRDIYEGGHHVPFLIRWPGHTKPSSTTDALASQIDLMATFAELVDYELPEDQAEDSHSLLPILTGAQESVRTQHVHNTFEKQFALRDGDWVFIDSKTGYRTGRYQNWDTKHGYAPVDPKVTCLLFNIKDDPSQRHNLASRHPERVEAMKAKLDAIKSQSHYLSK